MKRCALWMMWVTLLAAGCGTDYSDTSYRTEAETKFQVGHLEEAKTLLQQALSRDPSDPFALYYLGRIAAQEQRWEDAIYYYQCCLDVDPSHGDARAGLAVAEEAAGVTGTKLRFIPLPPNRK